ncbi:hypothetical protein FOL47_000580 [Perkinsus chesapeaki]|uniref:Uncharacterized protein n=1 Tax=Perkinsus chesapeaki TaxID=330153 RepID=A0A7J6MLF8_PERCH|nr:hypothetical protein FOL47_000580 [Perkinsus chesapeaki]
MAELLLTAAAGACTVGCGAAAATVASGVMTGGSVSLAALSLAASAGYTAWRYLFSEEKESRGSGGGVELYEPSVMKEEVNETVRVADTGG